MCDTIGKPHRTALQLHMAAKEKAAAREVLPTDTPEQFKAAVSKVTALLRRGEVVALPTETVYGLAANALNSVAVARIFELKGRPANNPIIVHVSSVEMARECVSDWPPLASKLAGAFWPGPLTLVLPRASNIPDAITAGGPTVGLRWPSHPLIQAVIRECGFPLAAPSANLSNQISPTTAEHVRRSLDVKLIVDGGPSHVGIESTVLDLTVDPPAILRPGIIHAESILAVTGHLAGRMPAPGSAGVSPASQPKSPGMLLKHYAPKAKLRIANWDDDSDLHSQIQRLQVPPERVHIIAHSKIPMRAGALRVTIIPHDAEAYARALYAELHRCDEEHAEMILVEDVPETPEWHAIRDRLQRASSE